MQGRGGGWRYGVAFESVQVNTCEPSSNRNTLRLQWAAPRLLQARLGCVCCQTMATWTEGHHCSRRAARHSCKAHAALSVSFNVPVALRCCMRLVPGFTSPAFFLPPLRSPHLRWSKSSPLRTTHLLLALLMRRQVCAPCAAATPASCSSTAMQCCSACTSAMPSWHSMEYCIDSSFCDCVLHRKAQEMRQLVAKLQ